MSVPEGQATPSFGRYQDPVMLGAGGMGAVYKAIDPSLDRFVAIKVLTHREPKYVERFRREAQVLAKIMHPSIIQIYEIVGSDEGGTDPYIVMEYFDGKPLDSALKDGPMSAEQVVSILRQTADGLRKAHANNVIHRDIKPANLMLAETGDVKILDFGIAKATDAKKDLTGQTVLGTPYYMSPEQAMGHPIDGRSDLYSLGITAFQLLTGRRPFEAKNKVDVMLMQVKTPLPKLRDFIDIDERLEALIEKLCAKQPVARHQSCQELIQALDLLPSVLRASAQTPKTVAQAPGARAPPPPSATAQERPVQAEAPRPAPAPRPATPAAPHRVAAPTPQTPNRPPPVRAQPASARPSSRPEVRKNPPAAVPKQSSKALAGIAAGGGLALAVLGGAALWFLKAPKTGGFRVPAKGWSYPGAPAPPLKRVQIKGGYGNCVFSTKELERGKESPGALRTIFSVDEGLWGRCYFAHQIGPNKPGEVWQELWVDGQKRAQIIYDSALPNDEDQLALEVSRQHASRLAELSAGKHTLDIWIYRQGEEAETPEPLAAGELTVRK